MRAYELIESIIDEIIAGYANPEMGEGDPDNSITIGFADGKYWANADTYEFAMPTIELMVAELKKLGFTYRIHGEDLFGQVE